MAEEKNPIVQLHEYYYTQTEVDNNFAPRVHNHNTATTSSAGFMSAQDKINLDRCGSYQIFIRHNDWVNNPLKPSEEETDKKLPIKRYTGSVYAMVKKNDNTIVENEYIYMIINGQTYYKQLDPNNMGFASKSIELPPGEYLVITIYRKDGWTMAMDARTIKVYE